MINLFQSGFTCSYMKERSLFLKSFFLQIINYTSWNSLNEHEVRQIQIEFLMILFYFYVHCWPVQKFGGKMFVCEELRPVDH